MVLHGHKNAQAQSTAPKKSYFVSQQTFDAELLLKITAGEKAYHLLKTKSCLHVFLIDIITGERKD